MLINGMPLSAARSGGTLPFLLPCQVGIRGTDVWPCSPTISHLVLLSPYQPHTLLHACHISRARWSPVQDSLRGTSSTFVLEGQWSPTGLNLSLP